MKTNQKCQELYPPEKTIVSEERACYALLRYNPALQRMEYYEPKW